MRAEHKCLLVDTAMWTVFLFVIFALVYGSAKVMHGA